MDDKANFPDEMWNSSHGNLGNQVLKDKTNTFQRITKKILQVKFS